MATKSKASYLKRNPKCVVCGARATTIDHIVPRVVFDFTAKSDYDYNRMCNWRENWQPMCRRHNQEKSCIFDANTLPLHVRDHYKVELDEYLELLRTTLEQQDNKCALCARPITETTSALVWRERNVRVVALCGDCIINYKGANK